MNLYANLFVYGTLRPGEANYLLIQPAVFEIVDGVTTSGRLYHVAGGTDEYPIYPVAKFDEEGTIVGTLLRVDPEHESLRYVCRMELGAGFEPQGIRAGDDFAIGFHYPHPYVGNNIPSGDWLVMQSTQTGGA